MLLHRLISLPSEWTIHLCVGAGALYVALRNDVVGVSDRILSGETI